MANILEVKQLIADADVCGHVPLVKGLHGIGKSESADQYARETDMWFEPLILSLMDTGDMLGLPITEKVGGMTSTVWAAPSWYTNIVNAAWPNALPLARLQFEDPELQEAVLERIGSSPVVSRGELNEVYCLHYRLPTDRLQLLRQENVRYLDARRSVLFLDEFNRANADILNASLQLILEHRLHSHILPVVDGQETLIVAAINPADGDYSVLEFDPALLDRFVEIEAIADFKSWLVWAKAKKLNKIVIDFLIDNQSKFHFVPKDGSKGASPRSWTRLAKYVDELQAGKRVSPEGMTHYFKGTIGTTLAAQFLNFYNTYDNSISVKDLVKMVKKEVTRLKKAKEEVKPDVVSLAIEEAVNDMEAIRRNEFAEALLVEFSEQEDHEKAIPLLAFMYALPIENLSGVLKGIQNNGTNQYENLVRLDKEANNKGLFRKLVSLAAKK